MASNPNPAHVLRILRRARRATALTFSAALAFSASLAVTAQAAPRLHSKSEIWCLARLFDKDPLAGAASEFEPLTDLFDAATIRAAIEAMHPPLRAPETLSESARVALLKSFPIAQVTAAPGHLFLRNPKQLASLKAYITSSDGGDFSHDPLLFNLITDEIGSVLSVDLWNAHHRLVAYLEAGYHSLGEIPERNFRVLINGKTADPEHWSHYLSVAGLDESKNIAHSVVPVTGEIRVGTVGVSGVHSNFLLGSRNTTGQLRRNMLYRKQPKIGVFFGTFDPPHQGHLFVVKQAIQKLGLDEAVIVPNPNPLHKPGATSLVQRTEMVSRAIQGEPRVNVYLGDSGTIINTFGRDPFFERIAQSYGTHDIYQIIGEDSYEKLLAESREGKNTLNKTRKYAVVPRTTTRPAGKSGPEVPEDLKSQITLLEEDPYSLSSTTVRRMIAEKVQVGPEVLNPETLDYIQSQGLYRPR